MPNGTSKKESRSCERSDDPDGSQRPTLPEPRLQGSVVFLSCQQVRLIQINRIMTFRRFPVSEVRVECSGFFGQHAFRVLLTNFIDKFLGFSQSGISHDERIKQIAATFIRPKNSEYPMWNFVSVIIPLTVKSQLLFEQVFSLKPGVGCTEPPD